MVGSREAPLTGCCYYSGQSNDEHSNQLINQLTELTYQGGGSLGDQSQVHPDGEEPLLR